MTRAVPACITLTAPRTPATWNITAKSYSIRNWAVEDDALALLHLNHAFVQRILAELDSIEVGVARLQVRDLPVASVAYGRYTD